jgi:branched-chain amino acid transport system substrate-binding protein
MKASALVAALLPVLTLAAACGNDSEASPDGSTTSATAPAGSFPGKKATGTPIKFGVINPEGGPTVSQPEDREAAEAVIKYANDNLGGVAGHKIELVICKDKEDGVSNRDCANQMVQNKVAAVLVTTTAQGDQMAPVITKAGIPYVSTSGTSGSELTGPNTFMWTGGYPATLISMAKYSGQQHYKSVVAYVTDSGAVTQATRTFANPAFAGAGVGFKIVPIPLGVPDSTSQVSAGLQGKPGAAIIVGDSTVCTSVMRSLQTLASTVPKLLIQPCMDPATVKAVGSAMEGSRVFTTTDGVSDASEAQLYRAIMAKYTPKSPTAGYAQVGYQGMLSLVRATQGLSGDPTSANVLKTIKSAKNVKMPLADGATFTCDDQAIHGLRAICSAALLVASVKNGKPVGHQVVQ